MFCHKCGDKSTEGSTFCPKCGAKLIVDDTSNQATTSSATQMMKNKKLGIIAVIALLVPIIGMISFFTLRNGSEGRGLFEDDSTMSAYTAQSDIQPSSQEIEHSISVEDSPFEPLVDTTGWVRMGYLRIPPTWDFGEVQRICGETYEIINHEEATRYHRQVTIVADFETDTWMSAEFSVHDHPIVDTVAMLYDALNNHTSSRIVEFDDRHSVVMYELDDRITWLDDRGTTFTIVNLYHAGDRSIFENDQDTIMTVVSTIFGIDRNAVAIRRAELDRQRFAAELTAERIANAGVTLDNFESLRSGMSHYVVSQILGSSGALSLVTRTPNPDVPVLDHVWRTYVWDSADAGSGITVVFRNGHLHSMSQNGLR